MALRYIAILGCILGLVYAQTSPIQNFHQRMENSILSGDVKDGEGEREEPLPAGIQGWTLYIDSSPAYFTWVEATAIDAPQIHAWTHTTWSIYYNYYVLNTNTPQSIQIRHQYYIKGFRWVPTDHPEFPPPPHDPVKPDWATGVIESDVYKTEMYARPEQQIPCNVYLTHVYMW